MDYSPQRSLPLSMKFSRQQYWSGLSFPTPTNLPDSRIEITSLVILCWQVDVFTTEPPGKPCFITAVLLSHLFSVPAFLYSFKIITEACSKASTVARLRPQIGLGQNVFSYVKKAVPGSFSLETPWPICLQKQVWFLDLHPHLASRLVLWLCLLSVFCCPPCVCPRPRGTRRSLGPPSVLCLHFFPPR